MGEKKTWWCRELTFPGKRNTLRYRREGVCTDQASSRLHLPGVMNVTRHSAVLHHAACPQQSALTHWQAEGFGLQVSLLSLLPAEHEVMWPVPSCREYLALAPPHHTEQHRGKGYLSFETLGIKSSLFNLH